MHSILHDRAVVVLQTIHWSSRHDVKVELRALIAAAMTGTAMLSAAAVCASATRGCTIVHTLMYEHARI